MLSQLTIELMSVKAPFFGLPSRDISRPILRLHSLQPPFSSILGLKCVMLQVFFSFLYSTPPEGIEKRDREKAPLENVNCKRVHDMDFVQKRRYHVDILALAATFWTYFKPRVHYLPTTNCFSSSR